MIRLKVLHPIYCSGRAISHICLSLCEHMRGDGLEVQLTVPASDPAGRRCFARDAIPRWLKSAAYRLDRSAKRIERFTENRFLRDLQDGDIVYLWPGVSLRVYEAVKARGHTLVMERINTHRATARRILDDAYGRLGWPPTHGITDAAIKDENAKLALADYVFSPSPCVAQSLLDAGVPSSKILPSSYGWDPARFSGTHKALPPIDGLTVLFMGHVCVRKGAHLLLEAWRKAGVKGRLVLVGRIAEDIAAHCADDLNRPDVLHLDYTDDPGAIYRSADVFAFPTLEEGSPLVSYEALAHGLPAIISPMGAGEVIRDGVEGLIHTPYGMDGWIRSLHTLAGNADCRMELSDKAKARSRDFTWAQAARRRGEHLLAAASRLCSRSHNPKPSRRLQCR